MRELDGDYAARSEQNLHAFDKIVQIGHMREHIVRWNEIGLQTFGDHLPSDLAAEVFDTRRHADLARGLGHLLGRFDSQAWYAALDEVLEQVAVVTGQFHDVASRVESEALDHLLGVMRAMSEPAIRVGGEIH